VPGFFLLFKVWLQRVFLLLDCWLMLVFSRVRERFALFSRRPGHDFPIAPFSSPHTPFFPSSSCDLSVPAVTFRTTDPDPITNSYVPQRRYRFSHLTLFLPGNSTHLGIVSIASIITCLDIQPPPFLSPYTVRIKASRLWACLFSFPFFL